MKVQLVNDKMVVVVRQGTPDRTQIIFVLSLCCWQVRQTAV